MPVRLLVLLAGAVVAAAADPPATVSFATADGGTVFADLYDGGDDGVVLAHGAVFDKESWCPLAQRLAARGRRVLAIDFRGYGKSAAGAKGDDGRFEDVLAAVRELRRRGAAHVAVVGASMGGRVAAEAAVAAPSGVIDRLILLSPAPIAAPERLRGPTLFVLSAAEPAAERIRAEYDRTPEPKRLVIIPGAAHAQHVFAIDQGPRLTETLIETLTAP